MRDDQCERRHRPRHLLDSTRLCDGGVDLLHARQKMHTKCMNACILKTGAVLATIGAYARIAAARAAARLSMYMES